MTQDTPLASVFSCGKFVGSILHRGVMGYEAVGEDNTTSHGFFNSQKEAATALQMAVQALHPIGYK